MKLSLIYYEDFKRIRILVYNIYELEWCSDFCVCYGVMLSNLMSVRV